MKAIRFVIPKTSGNSFRVQVDRQPYFYDSIHYHPEHQVTLLLKGEGTCFIGNHVERFEPGNVYLIGKNVPHVFRSDGSYYDPASQQESHSISIFFKDETFGSAFFEIPEMAHIKRLLELASMGLKISGEDRQQVADGVLASREQESFQRFQNLLSILDLFANSTSLSTLSSVRYTHPSKESDHERINVVFQFLSSHFKSEISLAQISSIASMTPNAFCRYFKQRTGKSFSSFLIDMRVEYAGKLIAGSHDSFGNIAIASGFNSISYFNRQFKRVTGITPLMYRKKYRHDLAS